MEPEYELFAVTVGYGQILNLYKRYRRRKPVSRYCALKIELYALVNELDWYRNLGFCPKNYLYYRANKCNHEWLEETIGVTDFLDKEQNIRAGVFVLRKLFEEYTDPNLVLMAYNMGSNGAEKLWNKGIYSTPYVDEILTYQAEFEKQLEERNGEQ